MNLRDYIEQIAETYDAQAGMSAPAQRMLRGAAAYVREHAPAGFIIEGSGGRGHPTPTPWFGFLNPDETSSPQEGLYLVYIFSSGLGQVTLILIQGISRLFEAVGAAEARKRLAADSEALRKGLGKQLLEGLDSTAELESTARLQRGYIAGTVTAHSYDTRALPKESQLRSHLLRFFGLYDEAIAVKRQLLQTRPGQIATPSGADTRGVNPFEHFKPKDEGDYQARVVGRTITKSRRHEWLIREYGEWAQANGFVASTPHPRDLVLAGGDRQWLIEGKVVRRGNAMNATREALGQLYWYRDVHEDWVASPQLVALFTEPVGAAFVGFLDGCGVESVWWEQGKWMGSPAALTDELAQS